VHSRGGTDRSPRWNPARALRRVHALTVEWSAAPRTQLASICHASYGTDGFRHVLLPTTDRQRLQQVIGPDAEALVYLYGDATAKRTYASSAGSRCPCSTDSTGTSRSFRGAELRDSPC